MKRKVSEVPASFYCRGCTLGKSAGGSARKNFKGKIRKTTHIGKIGTTVICGGLTKHLFHANYAPCLAHYTELGLLSSDKKHVDYTTSLRNTHLLDEPNAVVVAMKDKGNVDSTGTNFFKDGVIRPVVSQLKKISSIELGMDSGIASEPICKKQKTLPK